MELLTPQNLMFAITMATILVNIVITIRKPQERSALNDALFKQEMANLHSRIDEKFMLSENQITNLKDNHIHTLEKSVDENRKQIILMDKGLAELKAIINERIPKN